MPVLRPKRSYDGAGIAEIPLINKMMIPSRSKVGLTEDVLDAMTQYGQGAKSISVESEDEQEQRDKSCYCRW